MDKSFSFYRKMFAKYIRTTLPLQKDLWIKDIWIGTQFHGYMDVILVDVKGKGSVISKYVISLSASYKRTLEHEKLNATLHTEVKQLKKWMREMEQIFASHGGGQM